MATNSNTTRARNGVTLARSAALPVEGAKALAALAAEVTDAKVTVVPPKADRKAAGKAKREAAIAAANAEPVADAPKGKGKRKAKAPTACVMGVPPTADELAQAYADFDARKATPAAEPEGSNPTVVEAEAAAVEAAHNAPAPEPVAAEPVAAEPVADATPAAEPVQAEPVAVAPAAPAAAARPAKVAERSPGDAHIVKYLRAYAAKNIDGKCGWLQMADYTDAQILAVVGNNSPTERCARRKMRSHLKAELAKA